MPTPFDPALGEPLARSFLYSFLARLYEYPDSPGWNWLCSVETLRSIRSAVQVLGLKGSDSETSIRDASQSETTRNGWGEPLMSGLRLDQFDSYLNGYVEVFGHAARGPCPINEIEYGDLKADPLFQPHRLADLMAFYRAFGLECSEEANERPDHICFQLEFMSVLTAQEAYATSLTSASAGDRLEVLRHAQRQFLKEHLGRWAIAFTRRLERMAGETLLRHVAELTRTFVEFECRRMKVRSGNDDLALRVVDQAEESLCDTCGLRSLPPGA